MVAAALVVLAQVELWATNNHSGAESADHPGGVADPGVGGCPQTCSGRGRLGRDDRVLGPAAGGGWVVEHGRSAWMCALYGARGVDGARAASSIGCGDARRGSERDCAGHLGPKGSPATPCCSRSSQRVAMLLVRRAVRDRQLLAEALAARAELLEREQELRAHERGRRGARADRPRAARPRCPQRERDGGAGRAPSATRWPKSRPRTRETLRSIEQAGRQALAEARRLLGMLRRGDERERTGAAAGPRPARRSSSSRSGVPACRSTLDVEGERVAAARRASICAPTGSCRRALTNALKHAGPAHAEVCLRYAPRRARCRGPRRRRAALAASRGNGAGHGLIGMRERVALYGGRLDRRRRATAAALKSARGSRCS